MQPLAEPAIVRIGGPMNARPVGGTARTTTARSLAEIAADVATSRDAGARSVVFAGGEPTIRRDLAPLVALPHRAGLRSGLVSSGRALVYPSVRSRILRGGVDYVRVALHAPTAAVHDRLVGVEGAFDQTWAGLSALLTEAPRELFVDVACTVVAPNAELLVPLVQRLSGLERSATLGIRFVAPLVVDDAAEWPAQGTLARVEEALELAGALAASWEGFPPCLLAGHAEARDERLRWGAPAYGPEDGGDALLRERADGREKPYPCRDCIHGTTCPGAPTPALEHWGEAALAPVRGVRANSFNFEQAEDLGEVSPSAADCAVRARTHLAHPVRDLVLLRDGAASLYRSPTLDFSDAEVRRTRDELEQVYLDISETAVLTEFTSGIRRVRPHSVCSSCSDRARCPAVWEIDPELPFSREERWLKKEVSRARGRVLDVGCGEQPYRAEIAAGIAAGHIDYHGLDPDAAAIERFRAAGVGGRLEVGSIEDLDVAQGFYDYVFVFRSLNHFFDLERAFTVIERALRVGGMLYVCDSVVFAMLRTRAQVEWADTHAAVGHEHYRNWSSEELLDFLQRYRFRVNVHRPVSPDGSNQWILKLLRSPNS
jgi:SAM-dependent methyltransferase/pyruvate-formate lyase-activating enzyme